MHTHDPWLYPNPKPQRERREKHGVAYNGVTTTTTKERGDGDGRLWEPQLKLVTGGTRVVSGTIAHSVLFCNLHACKLLNLIAKSVTFDVF